MTYERLRVIAKKMIDRAIDFEDDMFGEVMECEGITLDDLVELGYDRDEMEHLLPIRTHYGREVR